MATIDNGHDAAAFLVRVANLLDRHVGSWRGITVKQWRGVTSLLNIDGGGQKSMVATSVHLFMLVVKLVEKTDGKKKQVSELVALIVQ